MNITTNDSQILLALNKPKGYLVTRSDDLGRKTVYNLLPDSLFQDGWMPIGRLDLESKGLLLFTRNGKINDALTKPGNCIKVYEVWVRGHVTDEHIIDASSGVESIHGLLKAKVERIGNVLELNRISIGSFKPNIEIGKWRYLSTDEEIMLIKRAIKVV